MKSTNRKRVEFTESRLNGVYWEADPDTLQVSYINPKVENLLGYPPDEWLGRSLIHTEKTFLAERDSVIDTLNEKIERKEYCEISYHMLDSSGDVLRIKNLVSFQENEPEAGLLYGLMFNAADQDPQIQELNSQSRKPQLLADVGHWMLDLENNRLVWSPEVKKICEVESSYQPDIESAIKFYQEGYDRKKIQQVLKIATETGASYEVDLKIVSSKGKTKWVRTLCETEMVDGRCTKLYGKVKDITRQKVAEKELERLSLIARETQNLVIITTPDEKIKWVNKAFEKSTGYTLDEVKGKNPNLLQGPETDSRTVARIAKKLKREEPFAERILNYTKEGKPYWLNMNITPVRNKAGEVTEFFSIQEDVTDQVEMEHQLMEQTERLVEAQRLGKIGDWYYDLQTGDISWSEMTFEIFECDKSLPVPPLDQILNFYNDKELISLIERAIKYSEKYSKDFEIITEKGNSKFVKTMGIPVVDDTGHVIAVKGIVQDITERKKAEMTLKQQQEQLSSITNNINGLIQRYLLKPDGTDKITFISDGVMDVYEITPVEALESSRQMWDQIPEEDLNGLLTSIEESAENMKRWDHTWSIKTPAGRLKYLHGRGHPVKLDDGSIRWDSVIFDMTEQEMAKRERKELNDLVEKSINEIYIIDAESLLFVYVNDPARRNLGYSESEILKMTAYDLKPEYDRNEFLQLINPLKKKLRNEIYFQTVHKRRDGTLYPVDAYLRRDVYKHQDVIVATILDVTERVKSENRNSILLQEVHHRVKNNLAIISSLLSLEMDEFDDERAKLSFQRSMNRIHSIAKVHELLYDNDDYSTVNIKKYLRELFIIIKGNFAGSRDTNIELDIENIDMNINEAIPLGMLLNELLTNSLKYAFVHGDGHIFIKIRQENDAFTVVFSDDGHGMNQEPDLESPKTLGFMIVKMLLLQLGASFELDTDEEFRLEFVFRKKTKGSYSNL